MYICVFCKGRVRVEAYSIYVCGVGVVSVGLVSGGNFGSVVGFCECFVGENCFGLRVC